MAGPWEKYQSTPTETLPSEGPWAKYQQPQTEQSPPQTGGDIVSAAEQRFGLPSGLLGAVISKESSGNSKAISPKGAIGLGQVTLFVIWKVKPMMLVGGNICRQMKSAYLTRYLLSAPMRPLQRMRVWIISGSR